MSCLGFYKCTVNVKSNKRCILRSDLVFPKPYLTSKIELECTKNHVKMINQKVFVYNIDWREQESCISNIDSLWKSKNVYNTCI